MRHIRICAALCCLLGLAAHAQARPQVSPEDDLLFIHHSCGGAWLYDGGLRDALLAKGYIDEVNEITYGDTVSPDPGRPDSLPYSNPDALPGEVEAVPHGDATDMCHWVKWFNDYLEAIKAFGCDDGQNRIIMFKSCYPSTAITAVGTPPGYPFYAFQLVDYYSVFTHPSGTGNLYQYRNYGQVSPHDYQALEDVFAANPDTLFIHVSSPPIHAQDPYQSWATPQDLANYRTFDNWLKQTWEPGYNARNPGLHNMIVFDWYDFLAYPPDHPQYPNFLRDDYASYWDQWDSHPNETANQASTAVFATNPDNILDRAWRSFTRAGVPMQVIKSLLIGE